MDKIARLMFCKQMVKVLEKKKTFTLAISQQTKCNFDA